MNVVERKLVEPHVGDEKKHQAIYPPGGGGTHYNELHWEASSERGALFRLEVYKRVADFTR